jgi:hypothetical protein
LDLVKEHAHERRRLYVNVRGPTPAPEAPKLPVDFHVVKEDTAVEDQAVFETLTTFFDDAKGGKQPQSRILDWSVENRVILPRIMVRPEWRPIDMERLAAIYKDCVSISLEALRDGFTILGSECVAIYLSFGPLANVNCTFRWYNSSQGAIPQIQAGQKLGPKMNVKLTYQGAPPTHLLIVFDPMAAKADPADPTVHRGHIPCPTHAAVIQAHCADVPALGKGCTDEPDEDGMLELPTFFFPIPYPRMWNFLHSYLYIKHPSVLLNALLPENMARPYSGICDPCDDLEALAARKDQIEQMVHDLSRQFAQAYTAYTLLTYVRDINGMRLNASTLGIHEDGLWFAIDLSYKIILKALAIGCSFKPIRMVKAPLSDIATSSGVVDTPAVKAEAE